MKKIEFFNGNESFSFGIGTVKYIYGDNIQNKDKIIKIFRHIFEKCEDGDYVLDHDMKLNLEFDENPINLRQSEYYEVSSFKDMLEEMKIKAKSMLSNVLLTALQDIEYNDEYNTLSMLFDDFGSTIHELLPLQESSIKLDVTMKPLDAKSLIKLLELNFLKDEKLIFPYELSYKEYLEVQIDLLIYLAKKNIAKEYYIIMHTHTLTEELNEKLKTVELKNIHILVFIEQIKIPLDKNEVVLLYNNTIDLADEVEVYNSILLPLPCCSTKAELDNILTDYLLNETNERTIALTKIL